MGGGGHHQTGFFFWVISIVNCFRVFFKVKIQNGNIVWGYAKISSILGFA